MVRCFGEALTLNLKAAPRNKEGTTKPQYTHTHTQNQKTMQFPCRFHQVAQHDVTFLKVSHRSVANQSSTAFSSRNSVQGTQVRSCHSGCSRFKGD